MKRSRSSPLTLYFDTNVYDVLLDAGLDSRKATRIWQAIRENEARVFFSNANLVELAGVADRDPERAKRLYELSIDYCIPTPTRPYATLIEREVSRLSNRKKELSPFESVNTTSGKAFMKAWRELAKLRDFGLAYVRLAADAQMANKEAYREYLSKARSRLSEVGSVAGRIPRTRITYEHLESIPSIREMHLEPTLASFLRASRIDEDPQLVWAHLDECPALSTQFRYDTYTLWHDYIVKRGKHGSDAYDRRHAAYGAYADVFVCEDRYLRNTLLAIGWGRDSVVRISELGQRLSS